MREKIELDLYWPEEKEVVACGVRVRCLDTGYGYAQNAVVYLGEDDVAGYSKFPDEWIIIMRPKPEPRFTVRCPDNMGRLWCVFKDGSIDWAAALDRDYDPDAERHAREFADMLNREAQE